MASPCDFQQLIEFREKYYNKKIGFTCSCFDLLHTGHVIMLKDAKDQCDILVVGLQTDPTLDRPDTKNKPVQDFEERNIMINAIRYVDKVVKYSTETDLQMMLKTLAPDIRILGTDWKNKTYTGHELNIPIYWHTRNHGWSTTNLRNRVYECEVKKKLDDSTDSSC